MGCQEYELDNDQPCITLLRRTVWILLFATLGFCALAFQVGRDYQLQLATNKRLEVVDAEVARRLEIIEREQERQRQVYEYLLERWK